MGRGKESVVLEEVVYIFASDNHTFGRADRGLKGRGSVGLGEFMKVEDVALVGTGVGRIREYKEVERFLFES